MRLREDTRSAVIETAERLGFTVVASPGEISIVRPGLTATFGTWRETAAALVLIGGRS